MGYPVSTAYGEIVVNTVAPHPPADPGIALSTQAKLATNNSGGVQPPNSTAPPGSGGTTGTPPVALPPTHIWSPPRGGGVIAIP